MATTTTTDGDHREHVRITTLGGFAVEVGGRVVPTSEWGSRHARTIVKRLALARGWPVTRDALVEILWPGEADHARSRARLSVQLTTVRRVLGGGLVADRESVRLDLERLVVDLVELDDAPDDDAVLEVWGGDLLPEDLDAAWTQATRAEVAARAGAAAVRLAERHLTEGRPDRAASIARRLLDAAPLALRGHELLVTALLETDRHGLAALAHASWVDAGHELGVPVPRLVPA